MTTATKLEAPTLSPKIGWVVAFTALSWLGEAIHNRADLPQLSLLSPEYTIPGLISLVLLLGLWLSPWKRLMRWALLSWAWINLLGGGILSVLPLPFLPFSPEQTVFHHSMHVVYVVTQIPLIVVLLQLGKTTSHHRPALLTRPAAVVLACVPEAESHSQ